MATSKQLPLRQQVFREVILGTLIYITVLGFFNEYTNFLSTTTFTITFLTAILLQLLVYPTIQFKKFLVKWWNASDFKYKRAGMIFSVWLVMFFSKFIFLDIITIVLGRSVDFSGFIGLALIILITTVITQGITLIEKKLR